MLLPVEPPEGRGLIKTLFNISVSALVLIIGAWAAENQLTISKLWDKVATNAEHEAQLHEAQALTQQELKHIEVQLDDLKTLINEHNQHDH